MRLYTLVALLIVVVLTLDAIGECEGWFGSRSRSSSGRSSSRSVSRTRTSTRRSGGSWGSRSRSTSRRTSRSRSVSRSRTSSTKRRGGFWGSGRRTTANNNRYNRNKPSLPKVSVKKTSRGTTIKAGSKTIHTRDFLKVRDRDETGHRTGLGTLGRKLVSQPRKTVEAIKSFAKSYQDMRKKNVIGGNLEAHRKGNKDATLKSDAKTAGAISALREQYKNFRVKQNKDKSIHIGDTRTKKERDATMNANKQGRMDAKNAKKP